MKNNNSNTLRFLNPCENQLLNGITFLSMLSSVMERRFSNKAPGNAPQWSRNGKIRTAKFLLQVFSKAIPFPRTLIHHSQFLLVKYSLHNGLQGRTSFIITVTLYKSISSGIQIRPSILSRGATSGWLANSTTIAKHSLNLCQAKHVRTWKSVALKSITRKRRDEYEEIGQSYEQQHNLLVADKTTADFDVFTE